MSDDGEGLEFGEIPLNNLSDLEEEAPEPVSLQNEAVKSEYKEIVIQPLYDDKTNTCGNDDTSDPPLPPPATPVHYACSFCESTFGSAVLLEAHMQSHIWGRKEFESISDIPQPSTSASGSKVIKRYACKFCELVFTNQKRLKDHCAHKHSIIYVCVKCKVKMTEPRLVWEHMKIHVDEANITCKLCSNQLSCGISLRQHVFAHVDKSPRCKTCGKIFCNNTYYMKHVREKHSPYNPLSETNTSVTGFACSSCSKVFLNAEYLEKHMATSHNGRTAEEEKLEEEFPCDKCNVVLGSAAALQEHVRHNCNVIIPTGKLPKGDAVLTTIKKSTAKKDKLPTTVFPCNQCGFRFSTHSKFKYHLSCSAYCREKRKRRAYSCQVCGIWTSSLREMERHFNIKHSTGAKNDSVSHGSTQLADLRKLPIEGDAFNEKEKFIEVKEYSVSQEITSTKDLVNVPFQEHVSDESVHCTDSDESVKCTDTGEDAVPHGTTSSGKLGKFAFKGHTLDRIVKNFAVFGEKDNCGDLEEDRESKYPLCICILCGWEFVRVTNFTRHVEIMHSEEFERVLGLKPRHIMPSDGNSHPGLIFNSDPANSLLAALPEANETFGTFLQVPNSGTYPAPAAADSLGSCTSLVYELKPMPALNTQLPKPVPANPIEINPLPMDIMGIKPLTQPIDTMEINPLTVSSMQTSFVPTTSNLSSTTVANLFGSRQVESNVAFSTDHGQMNVIQSISKNVRRRLSNNVQPNSSQKHRRKEVLKRHVDTRTEMQFTTYSEAATPCFKEPIENEEHFTQFDPKMHGVGQQATNLYPCTECNFSFPTEDELLQHLRRVHSPLFVCYICYTSFTSKEDLSGHHSLHHMQHVCGYCKQDYRSWLKLRRHLLTCVTCYHKQFENGVLHPCRGCHMTFGCKADLDYHMNIVHSQLSHFPCSWCKKTYVSVTNLEEHVKKKHASNAAAQPHKGFYKCHLCKEVFTQLQSLIDHEIQHTSKVERSCVGPISEKSSKASDDLMNPLQSHSEMPAKEQTVPQRIPQTHSSTICGKIYTDYSSYFQNLKKHGSPNYHCHLCGKLYLKVDDVRKHVESHLGDRRYQCSLCGLRYKTFEKAKVHMAFHNIYNVVKCPFTGRVFLYASWLRVHKKLERIYKSTLKCEWCRQLFKDIDSLWDHKIEHFMNGSDFYQCDKCPLLFLSAVQYQRHVTEFHRSSKKLCNICHCSFATSLGYIKDMERHLRESGPFFSPFGGCTDCIRGLSTDEEMVKHMRMKHGTQQSPKT